MSYKKGSCFYCKHNVNKFCKKLKLKIDLSQSCPMFSANRSKISKGSKAKGNKFENDVAKVYSKIFGVKFNRVPSSGGLRWKNRSDVIGDITITDEKYKINFVVECKNNNSWDLRGFLNSPENSMLGKFIKQAEDESKRSKKPFHLIVKGNRIKPLVILQDINIKIKPIMVFNNKYAIVNFIDFEKYLKANKKSLMFKIAK